MNARLAAAGLAASLACTFHLLAAAYRIGPPPAHSGGFGEPTCHACHFDGPLNEPGGSLTVRGFPEAWEPGASYTLEVVLARKGLKVAGLQLAVRRESGENAGVLEASSAGLVVNRAADNGVNYVQHTEAATRIALPDTARWLIRWKAPGAQGGIAILHAAANAANDDNSEFGDHIYSVALRAREGAR